MENKMLLVTGGAGFIGSNLCFHLVNAGYSVLCLDNMDGVYSKEIKLRNISLLLNKTNFVFQKVDICDREKIFDLFKKFNIKAVFHLAAKVNTILSFSDEKNYHDVIVLGTENLLAAAAYFDVKNFIFSSSSSVYGESKSDFMKESDLLLPVNPYGVLKAKAEELVLNYQNLHDFNAIILRFFNVYGRNIRPDLFIYKVYESIKHSTQLRVFNYGNNRKDFTYVSDVVTALVSSYEFCLGKQGISEIFNVGTGQNYSINEIINYAETILKKKANKTYSDKIRGDVTFTRADISKIANMINFTPSFSIEEGLPETFYTISNLYSTYINELPKTRDQ